MTDTKNADFSATKIWRETPMRNVGGQGIRNDDKDTLHPRMIAVYFLQQVITCQSKGSPIPPRTQSTQRTGPLYKYTLVYFGRKWSDGRRKKSPGPTRIAIREGLDFLQQRPGWPLSAKIKKGFHPPMEPLFIRRLPKERGIEREQSSTRWKPIISVLLLPY